MLPFLLFQRVRDQLYLTPPRVTGHNDWLGAYLGALGFTKPLEQLMLHTMPLHSLLDWLSEPQGPNFVETSATVAPFKALAIAVTKRTLYEEQPPRVGLGLMYKLHYISTVPFSVAYMHLNVWHSAASHEVSEKRLDVPHLLFMNISEMSNVIPVMVRHPVLLDWASREAMEGTVGPGSHHSFQGFRLHTTWKQPPTGGPTHHIALPCVLGEDNASLEYESEKFPQALMQGLKIAIVLKPPTQDHWNIALDPVLPWILADSQSQCEAQQVTQAEEEGSKEAGMSQPELPTHGEPPGIPIGGSGESLPMKMVPNRERVLETTREILGCIHDLHLQMMHKMGSVQEVDRTLARTLVAKFVRLQLIVGEDFTRSLLALHSDLEASCEALMSSIMRTIALHPNDPAAHQVKAALQTFQQSTSMKVTLPLMQLEAACGDMEEFMRSRLRELSSQTESRELIGALSQKLTDHASWVQQLVQAPELVQEEVSLRVIIGLGAHQPLKANFFPGILEGLVGRLCLAPPDVINPPTSVHEGMACHWAAILREAIRRTEGRDINLRQVASTVVPHGLHLDYDLDF